MESHIRQISKIYDIRATIPVDGSTCTNAVNFDLALLEDVVGPRPKNVCDIGCGLGWHLEALSLRGGSDLWGIDLSAHSLDLFARRCSGIGNGTVRIVFGDMMKWGVTNWFEAATSFLSCLGQFSREGDVLYLQSAARLLRPGGYFLMSVFCEELIDELVGEWTASYSSDVPALTESSVAYNKAQNLLTITQTLCDGTKVQAELIHIYNSDDLYAMAKKAGFLDVTVIHPNQVRSPPPPEGVSGRVFLLGRAEGAQ